MAKRKSRRADDYEYGWGSYFPRSRPIKPADGLQSRSQRGAFAANWWAKRWLSVLEGYGIGSRLQRGRSYARGGQVLNIEVAPGQVSARVQGSQRIPYQISITIQPLKDGDWERVLDTISQQAIFAAQLLDETMPQEIEQVFEAAQISLFPKSLNEITTDCSCPDYANPCKHIAAVYYLLGEQFDHDPFLIFTLRGRTRQQVIEALRARRAAAAGEAATGEAETPAMTPAPKLDGQMADFWGEAAFEWTTPHIARPEVNAGVLRRLGPPPEGTAKVLESLYRAMTSHVTEQVLGDDGE